MITGLLNLLFKLLNSLQFLYIFSFKSLCLSLMELALSLGDTSKPFSFLDKLQKIPGTDLGFCMAVGKQTGPFEDQRRTSSSDPPVQLDLLPFSPVHGTHPSSPKSPFPFLTPSFVTEHGRRPEESEERPSGSSPNNTAISSLKMDYFSLLKSATNKRDFEQFSDNNNGEDEADRGHSSRGSDEDLTRKKLRLSKEQSAFLEDSFKEHHTLNPKEKLALANQLNLSPRQVEVWFQNRRARTKLKQTEVDCEYLKRSCAALREENKRLQKEVKELRALNASKPFHMPTTLTMCPSCEKIPAAGAAAAAAANKLFSLAAGGSRAQLPAS